MRLVVDTNVVVSAAFKESSWPGSVVRWLDKFGGLLKSTATESQVIKVLQWPYIAPKLRPFYLDNVRRIFSQAELVTITESIAACRDPTDDKFLESAVAGRADMIVTGDFDLLALHPFPGIPIITPQAFGRARARAT
jgi:uncharacterized protein